MNIAAGIGVGGEGGQHTPIYIYKCTLHIGYTLYILGYILSQVVHHSFQR